MSPKTKTESETGYLEIIIGPMFSGKTSKLLEVYKQCKFCNIPVVVINYAEDTRYHDTMLSTHDKVMIPCIQTTFLNSICFKPSEDNLDYEKLFEQYQSIKEADVILINEAQFFQDLTQVVLIMLNNKKKVYVSGLDGDFKREKFGTILDLIPHCDKVTKLTSLCGLCKNGTPGVFSLRLTNENEQKLIGSVNYIPVCRVCYDSRVLQNGCLNIL
jgi:thymidine kinase